MAAPGDGMLTRIGAASGVAAAIALAIVNVLHTTREVGRAEDTLRAVAADASWTALHVVSFLPILLLVPFMLAATRQLSELADQTTAGSRAAAIARIAFASFAIGISVYMVRLALHGPVVKLVATNWVNGGGDTTSTAYLIATTVLAFNDAITGASTLPEWSGYALLGLAAAVGSAYPRWLGGGLFVAGAAVVLGVGVPFLVSGPSDAVNVIFVTFASTGIVLLFVYSILMWRSGSRPASA